ncbi:MAG: hypothetical protein IVW54_16830 [Candidatus Binataceae bacterium]|nr:hypothetical protein [Candidatus Binataceae bacterium]
MKRFRSLWAKERRSVRIARWTIYIAGAGMIILQLIPPALFPIKVSTWWARELQLLGFGGAAAAFANMCAELRLKYPRYYYYKLLDERIVKMLNGREPGPRAAVQITLFDPDADITVRAHDFILMPDVSEAERTQLAALMKRERKDWTN